MSGVVHQQVTSKLTTGVEHRVSKVLFVTFSGQNWEARPVHARELQLKLGLRLLHEEFLAPSLPQQTLEVGSPGLPG